MKIQLKRSNVLVGSAAKSPSAGQMEYGELAVNYNETDPAIFIKDSNNNIIRIAGADNIADDGTTNVPSGTTPPENAEAGNLWFNDEEGRLYIYYVDADSSQWVDASPDSWDPSSYPDVGIDTPQVGTLDDRYLMLNSGNDPVTGGLNITGGNVGIGKTSPAVALDVVGEARTSVSTTGTSNAQTLVTKDYVDSNISSSTFWSRTGTNVYPTTISDFVGVGTNSPGFPLTVKGIGRQDAAMIETDGTDRCVLSFKNSGTTQNPQVGSVNNDLIIRTGYVERLRVNNSGLVGIGEEQPSAALHVTRDSKAIFIAEGNVDDPTFPAYGFSGQNADNGQRGAGMILPSDNTLGFATKGAERLRIDSAGNVGIGTKTPQTKLVLANVANPTGYTYTTLSIVNSNWGGIVKGWINQGVSNGLILGSSDNGSEKDIVYIRNNETVGIGLDAPERTLHVKGNVILGDKTPDLDFEGMTIRSLFVPTASKPAKSFIDFQNYNKVATCHVFGNHFNDGSSKLTFGTTAPGDDSVDRRTTAMTITGYGLVGINTDDPQKHLQVNGDILVPSGNAYKTNCYYTSQWNYLDSSKVSGFVNMATSSERFSVGTGAAGQSPLERVSIFPAGQVTLGRTSVLTNSPTNEALLTISDNAANLGNIAYVNLHNSAAIQNNYTLGQLNYTGQSSFGYIGAAIRGKATETWNSNDHGGRLEFATVGNGGNALTTRAYIDSNGINVSFNHGIAFNPTGNAPGATSNTLYDYEEGTWTPTLTSENPGNGAFTPSGPNGGIYIKVGNEVYVQFNLRGTWTAGTASGAAYITGLPYNVVSNSNSNVPGSSGYAACIIPFISGITLAPGETLTGGLGQPGLNTIRLFAGASGGSASLILISNFGSTINVHGSMTYRVG